MDKVELPSTIHTGEDSSTTGNIVSTWGSQWIDLDKTLCTTNRAFLKVDVSEFQNCTK